VETRGTKLFVNGKELPVCSLGRWGAIDTDRELELLVELLGPTPHLIALSPNRAGGLESSRSWDVPSGGAQHACPGALTPARQFKYFLREISLARSMALRALSLRGASSSTSLGTTRR